jgi:hypothetical protein
MWGASEEISKHCDGNGKAHVSTKLVHHGFASPSVIGNEIGSDVSDLHFLYRNFRKPNCEFRVRASTAGRAYLRRCTLFRPVP